MRAIFAAALLAVATPVFADETTGKIVAFDRKANVIVLEDKTIWLLNTDVAIPGDLVAGNVVRLVYQTAGEDGLTKINALERVEG